MSNAQGADPDGDGEEGLSVASGDPALNQLLGLFDVPAFARRGAELDYYLERIDQRFAARRVEELRFVRIALDEWAAVATGPEDGLEVFATPLTPHWDHAGLELPTHWASRPSRRGRRRRVARRLAEAADRFNGRWTRIVSTFDLGPVNYRIDQYNKYYLLEKECLLGSPRLAARAFQPREPLGHDELLERFPTIPALRLIQTR